MDLKELAKALGLSADASKEDIFKAAGEMILAGKASKELLSAVEKGIKEHGLKLDGTNVVKTEPTAPNTIPTDGDSPEVADLKKRLTANEAETAKGKIGAAKALAQQYIKEGRIPPTMAEPLTQLLSIAGRNESLALSTDGTEVVKNAFDAAGQLKTLLDALPKFGSGGLSTAAAKEKQTKEAEGLSHAKKVARRATGVKEPAAAK